MSVIQKPEPVVKNEASESVFAPATERYELLDKEPEMEPYALRFSTETAYDESKAPQTISHPVPVESSSQGPGSLPQTAGNFSLYNFFCCFFCIPIFFFADEMEVPASEIRTVRRTERHVHGTPDG